MKRLLNLTIGRIDVCAESIIGLRTEDDGTATLLMATGAQIPTSVDRWEVISTLVELGYMADHYRNALQDHKHNRG